MQQPPASMCNRCLSCFQLQAKTGVDSQDMLALWTAANQRGQQLWTLSFACQISPGGAAVCRATAGQAGGAHAARQCWKFEGGTGHSWQAAEPCPTTPARRVKSLDELGCRFFSPSMTPALGSVQGRLPGSGQSLKMAPCQKRIALWSPELP